MIDTATWQKAGLPFELWLRYSQANPDVQKETEEIFFLKYPHLA